MKIFRLLILAMIITGIGFYSCKKDTNTTITSDAVLINSGPVSGCGYLLKVQLNGGIYNPINLTSEFQPMDSVNVRVTYRLLDSVRACTGTTAGGYRTVELKSIIKI